MLKESYFYYLVSELYYVNIDLDVINKYIGEVVIKVVMVDVDIIDKVIVVVEEV